MVVERDLGFDVESDSLPAVQAFFFNLATHMQAHARACYDFFYRKFDAVLINVVSKFACFFFLHLQLQNSYTHIYKHVQLVWTINGKKKKKKKKKKSLLLILSKLNYALIFIILSSF